MDEEVKSFKPTITPEGVAGVWLAQYVPSGDRSMQVHLGRVITAMMLEATLKAKKDALLELGKSPTIGAATASIEADLIEIERAREDQRVEGINYNIWDF